MENALVTLVAMAALIGLFRWATRPHTAFVVEDGKLTLKRGKPPTGLVHDLADVAKAVPDARGRIHLSGAGTDVHVEVSGLDESVGQRVRNVVQVHQRRIR